MNNLSILKRGMALHKTELGKTVSLSELALFTLTMMIWCQRLLVVYARAVIMRLPFVGLVVDEIIIMAYIILILLSLPEIFKSPRLTDIFLLFFVVLISLLQFFVFPENEDALTEHLYDFLLYTFPLYYIGLALDAEKMYPWLYRLSMATVVCFVIYSMFFGQTQTDALEDGDMWASYNLLPHVCVVIIRMLKKPDEFNVPISALGFFAICFLGSRGPLICLVSVLALYLMFFKTYRYPVRMRIAIVGIGVAVVMFMDIVMRFLQSVSETLGLSIRVFEKYFEGTLFESLGRESLTKQSLAMINERMFFGNGMFADRTELGVYCHNLVLELWLSFGVILGTIVIAAIVVVLFRAALRMKYVENSELLMLPLLAPGFLKLFLSGSFTGEMYLFLLMGICVRIIRTAEQTTQGKGMLGVGE